MNVELLTGEMHGVCILNWKWFRMFVSQEQQELKFAYNKVRKQLQEKVMEKPLINILTIQNALWVVAKQLGSGQRHVSLEPRLIKPNLWGSIIVKSLYVNVIIIHSKFSPISDWLKPHLWFTITSYCWPNLARILSNWTNDVKMTSKVQPGCRLFRASDISHGRGAVKFR